MKPRTAVIQVDESRCPRDRACRLHAQALQQCQTLRCRQLATAAGSPPQVRLTLRYVSRYPARCCFGFWPTHRAAFCSGHTRLGTARPNRVVIDGSDLLGDPAPVFPGVTAEVYASTAVANARSIILRSKSSSHWVLLRISAGRRSPAKNCWAAFAGRSPSPPARLVRWRVAPARSRLPCVGDWLGHFLKRNDDPLRRSVSSRSVVLVPPAVSAPESVAARAEMATQVIGKGDTAIAP